LGISGCRPNLAAQEVGSQTPPPVCSSSNCTATSPLADSRT
jgi:hypothetical protein